MAARDRARKLLSAYFEQPGARFLHSLKLSPNAVTLLGLAATALAAYLAASGALRLAGVALLLGGTLDMLDGALARLTQRDSRFGAALDSFADRLSEALMLLGLGIFYFDLQNRAGVVLAFLTLVASYLVSYLRARGEGLGIPMKEAGLGTRTERVLVTVAGLLTRQVIAALVIVLALSTFTVGQRLYHIWRSTRDAT